LPEGQVRPATLGFAELPEDVVVGSEPQAERPKAARLTTAAAAATRAATVRFRIMSSF
jgi:hypothetical protein